MTFAQQLRKAKGALTAKQVAAAIDNAVSFRTVQDWLQGRHTPLDCLQKLTLGALANLTGQPPVATWDGCETTADVKEYLAQENLSTPSASQKARTVSEGRKSNACLWIRKSSRLTGRLSFTSPATAPPAQPTTSDTAPDPPPPSASPPRPANLRPHLAAPLSPLPAPSATGTPP